MDAHGLSDILCLVNVCLNIHHLTFNEGIVDISTSVQAGQSRLSYEFEQSASLPVDHA
jgi:hypothetical protein